MKERKKMDKQILRVMYVPDIMKEDDYIPTPVKDVFEAKIIIDALSFVDNYTFDREVRENINGTIVLQMWDEDLVEWIDWVIYDKETGYYEDNLDNHIEFLEEKDIK